MESQSDTKLPTGIYMTLFDPAGLEVETVVLASGNRGSQYEKENQGGVHQHKSYHRSARTPGVHRICVKAHKALFYDNPVIKYEGSL